MDRSPSATATGTTRESRAISDAPQPAGPGAERPSQPQPGPSTRPPDRPILGRLVARGLLGVLVVIGVAAAIVASDLDRYWPLDLREPPGAFTQWRIRALAVAPDLCRRVLARSEVEVRAATPRPLSGGC